MLFKTIIEPFRVKMVEPIKLTSLEQRKRKLHDANYNLFKIRAEDVIIDLLTDSGTSAMSQAQWARMIEGDESYAGAKSYYDFYDIIHELTGFKHVYPTHQGRAAERILFSIYGAKGKIIPNNTHFDTTRANIEHTGTEALDLICDEAKQMQERSMRFKGNMNVSALEELFVKHGKDDIPLCMLTITNNSSGGQPVSMSNIQAVSKLCRDYKIPLIIDACRFAENAYFIKNYENGYFDRSIKSIVQEMFSYADGMTMSAKKDAFANIGGFLAFNDDTLAEEVKNVSILTEGFPTYGGLAGRDLSAIAQGLVEVIEEDYLSYRIRSTQYMGDHLVELGVPIVLPTGGHAIYVDAKKMLPQIPVNQFPGQALACALYLAGGIRSVEIGSFMFGKGTGSNFTPSVSELVRLAIPRRVYTQSHVDYVLEVFAHVYKSRDQLTGFTIDDEPPFLRHFSANLKPCGAFLDIFSSP